MNHNHVDSRETAAMPRSCCSRLSNYSTGEFYYNVYGRCERTELLYSLALILSRYCARLSMWLNSCLVMLVRTSRFNWGFVCVRLRWGMEIWDVTEILWRKPQIWIAWLQKGCCLPTFIVAVPFALHVSDLYTTVYNYYNDYYNNHLVAK